MENDRPLEITKVWKIKIGFRVRNPLWATCKSTHTLHRWSMGIVLVRVTLLRFDRVIFEGQSFAIHQAKHKPIPIHHSVCYEGNCPLWSQAKWCIWVHGTQNIWTDTVKGSFVTTAQQQWGTYLVHSAAFQRKLNCSLLKYRWVDNRFIIVQIVIHVCHQRFIQIVID